MHGYASLALLEQSVFVQDRPNSRLAKEHLAVAEALAKDTLGDPIGAPHFLNERTWRYTLRRLGKGIPEELGETLTAIERHHRDYGEVLFPLAELPQDMSDSDEAETVLTMAIAAGFYKEYEVFLRRARCRKAQGRPDVAAVNALHALRMYDDIGSFDTLVLMRRVRSDGLELAAESAAIAKQPAWRRVRIAADLFDFERQVELAETIIVTALKELA